MINHRIRIEESGSTGRTREKIASEEEEKEVEEGKGERETRTPWSPKLNPRTSKLWRGPFAPWRGDRGPKRSRKKFYEGLTGGLGRPAMYTRRYIRAASGPTDRPSVRPSDDVQRPTFLRCSRDSGSGILAPR